MMVVAAVVVMARHRCGSFRPFLIHHAIDSSANRVRIGRGLVGGGLRPLCGGSSSLGLGQCGIGCRLGVLDGFPGRAAAQRQCAGQHAGHGYSIYQSNHRILRSG
jgi:hypothetical protein